MQTWIEVCRVEDIPRLGARQLRRAGGDHLALFRNADDEVFALLDRCPHKGGPLSQGMVFGRSVACPLHNWTIALSSGEAAAPDEGCTPYFSVRVQDGEVQLRADELASRALEQTRPHAGPAHCAGKSGCATA